MPKPLSRWSRIGWAIAASSFALAVLAFLAWYFAPKPMSEAVALGCFLAGILGLTGVIAGVVIVFAKKYEARKIDELHAGKGVLAHWSYTQAEWDGFVRHELAETNKLAPWVLLLILGPTLGICLYATGGRLDPVILGTLALAGLIIWLVMYLPSRALARGGRGDVFIARDGALIHDQWHSWNYFGSILTNVTYYPGDPAAISFEWLQPGSGPNGLPTTRGLRVPVPHGHEDEAQQLVASLKP